MLFNTQKMRNLQLPAKKPRNLEIHFFFKIHPFKELHIILFCDNILFRSFFILNFPNAGVWFFNQGKGWELRALLQFLSLMGIDILNNIQTSCYSGL